MLRRGSFNFLDRYVRVALFDAMPMIALAVPLFGVIVVTHHASMQTPEHHKSVEFDVKVTVVVLKEKVAPWAPDGGNGENPLEQIGYHSNPAERLETSTAWFGAAT